MKNYCKIDRKYWWSRFETGDHKFVKLPCIFSDNNNRKHIKLTIRCCATFFFTFLKSYN